MPCDPQGDGGGGGGGDGGDPSSNDSSTPGAQVSLHFLCGVLCV